MDNAFQFCGLSEWGEYTCDQKSYIYTCIVTMGVCVCEYEVDLRYIHLLVTGAFVVDLHAP